MALINCPQCGETVSDKAKFCPHCNYPLSKMIKCDECGTEYEAGLSYCPSCGYPNSADPQKSSKKKHKILAVSLCSVFFVIIVTLIVIAVLKYNESEYYNKMQNAVYKTAQGCAAAEDAGNLIIKVWKNSIFEIRDEETDRFTVSDGEFLPDFNSSLNNLFEDAEFKEKTEAIKKYNSEAKTLMKDLDNPPKKYKEAYSVLKKFYETYFQFSGMVVIPSGNLNSFSEKFEKLDTDLIDLIQEMTMYFG